MGQLVGEREEMIQNISSSGKFYFPFHIPGFSKVSGRNLADPEGKMAGVCVWAGGEVGPRS